jgi:hypothetical protein
MGLHEYVGVGTAPKKGAAGVPAAPDAQDSVTVILMKNPG